MRPSLDIHEAAAATLLGLDLYCAARLAFAQVDRDIAELEWHRQLTHEHKTAWIERASVWLRFFAPQPASVLPFQKGAMR